MEPPLLRFSVLGSVRVWRDGAEVDPGPPLRRTLLALLLARDGSPVPLADIVRGLWAGRPPARAVNMIHRHIGELRRLLEPGLPARASGSRLVRGGGGYRLTVPAGSVDLLRFRELLMRAREIRGEGQAESAVAVFTEALRLWHGPAGGCPGEAPAHPVFTELDLEYAAAVRETADTALGSGTADRVLPTLTDTAHRYPLDEGLQARLMLALASAGRRAEAREVYRSTVARLAGELGVPPGPELNSAQERVTSETASPVTHFTQLPVAPPAFTGRELELAWLRALIDGGCSAQGTDRPAHSPVIAALGGTAGVGKTALAVHMAHEVADRFPDARLYVDLRGFGPAGPPLPPEEALREFLNALGVPAPRIPTGLDARSALYRSLLTGRRVLLLLDNARDAAQVRPLLPACAGCLVLVTSRNRLTALATADGAHPLTLDVLGPAEARAALAVRLGADRMAAEPAVVDEIVGLTARLPMALSAVAAQAASRPDLPLAALAARLRDGHGTLGAFRDPEATVDVQAVLSWSYDALGPDAARLFRLLASHPGPEVTVHAAAGIAGLSVPRTRAVLAELTGAHLLTERLPGRYAWHGLVHAYATELFRSGGGEGDRVPAAVTSAAHFVHSPLPTLLAPTFEERAQ
ncbi:AfsR/SARP family transcriptional regulator [Streptomyces sp. S3(2020)]|uniref:AfsR/SARP family transcriptional regulator n=1 Tax=Streptomyces sp. S3(2020) TaxID=2732044 RepID=UPI0014883F7C|nr:AfsR/SARP family transcriptional regulator [Streptomyces sp. S3(2020)]NNN35573.1 AfsR/SARP family transcriptional regulator [Streptomyces sp. S3(2020)]